VEHIHVQYIEKVETGTEGKKKRKKVRQTRTLCLRLVWYRDECIKRSIPTQKNGIKRVKNAKNIHKTRLKNGAYPFTLLKMGQKNGE
jgi:hypothetical protein